MKKITCTFFIILFIIETLLMSTLIIDVEATTPSGTIIENVKEVFAGPRKNMMFLLEDNRLFAGGSPKEKGQLGTPTTGDLSTTEQVNLINVLGNVVKVEIGYNFSLLLDDRGFVYATGKNDKGQLGMGDKTDLTAFTRVLIPKDVVIKDICASALTSYALAENGDLYGWGSGSYGSLNQGGSSNSSIDISTPKVIASGVKQFSASKTDEDNQTDSDNSLYVVKEDGNLYVCGRNTYGQFGLGNTTDLRTLTKVNFFDDKNIKQIQASSGKAFVLLEDGTAYSTGHNGWGTLGIPVKKDVSTWTSVIIPTGLKIEHLFRCSATQFFQLNDGQIWGTGSNDSGDLGFYSKDNTWNDGTSYDKYLMTNICTLHQVNVDGSTRKLTPDSGGGGEAAQNHTDPIIYKNGRIKSLSSGWNESFMVDSEGYLRVTGYRGDEDTSATQYAPDYALNPSKRQYHRMQTTLRTIKNPEVSFSGHEETITLSIEGANEEIPINPITITMGPKQSDTETVYEKFIIYKYDTSTDTKGNPVTSLISNPVTNGPLELKIEDLNLPLGDYQIEVYRTTNSTKPLESNHIRKVFRVSKIVKLSYDSNKGSGPDPFPPTDYYANSQVEVLDNKYTKGGYIFTSWNTAPDGSGDTYNPGESFTIEEDTILYAQWTPAFPHYVTNEEKDLILVAENFTIDINKIDDHTNAEKIKDSNVRAWNLSDGTPRESTITVQSTVLTKIGVYPVKFFMDGVSIEVYASVIDPTYTTINNPKNTIITGKGFIIDTLTAKNITDSEIIEKSNPKAWNLNTGGYFLDSDLKINKDSLTKDPQTDEPLTGDVKPGAYKVTFFVNDVTHTITVTVKDSNTIVDDSKSLLAIYGKSFVITLHEQQSITDDDILKSSSAKAWNLIDGTEPTEKIKVDKSKLQHSIGSYEVILSIKGVERKINVSVIDRPYTTENEKADTIIYAKDFSITLREYDGLDIIKESSAKAWRISDGTKLTDSLKIDTSLFIKEVGERSVMLYLDNGTIRNITIYISDSGDDIKPTIDNIKIISAPEGYKGESTDWSSEDIKLKIIAKDDVEINSDTFEVSYDNGTTWVKKGLFNATKTNTTEASVELTISSEGYDQNIYVIVKDISGNTSEHYLIGDKVRINIDKKAPSCNYKDGAIYKIEELEIITFIDNLSGIFSAILDDKDITSCTETPGPGKHKLVITDNAGNVTTINFTVEGYDNEVRVSGIIVDNDKSIIPRFNNGKFTDIVPETCVILRNTTSGKEYAGFLKYNEVLIYKNIQYGNYAVFCINPADIGFQKAELKNGAILSKDNPTFALTIEDNFKELIVTSTFLELKGFGNIYEKNETSKY